MQVRLVGFCSGACFLLSLFQALSTGQGEALSLSVVTGQGVDDEGGRRWFFCLSR